MLLIFINLSLQFYIKHMGEDSYIGGPLNGQCKRQVESSNAKNRLEFSGDLSKNGYLIIKAVGGKHVWTVGEGQILTYNYKINSPDQLFSLEMISPMTYLIKNRGRCVEYNPSIGKYILSECKNLESQKFIIFTKDDESKLKKKNGMNNKGDVFSKDLLSSINNDSISIAAKKRGSPSVIGLRPRNLFY